MADIASLTVAFSYKGLSQLINLKEGEIGDKAFEDGQKKRAGDLGDSIEKNWLSVFKDNEIHGLFELKGYPDTLLQNFVRDKIMTPLGDTAFEIIFPHYAEARPGDLKDHEHCECAQYGPCPPSYLDHDSWLQRRYISTLRQI
jgi:hypothetical protein